MPGKYGPHYQAAESGVLAMINWYEIMKQRHRDVLHGAQEEVTDTSQTLQRIARELAQFKLAQQPKPDKPVNYHDGHIPLLLGDTI